MKTNILVLVALAAVMGGCSVTNPGKTEVPESQTGEAVVGEETGGEPAGRADGADAGTVIEDVGLAITMSGYQMDGPMEMVIRRSVDDIYIDQESQGFSARTGVDNMDYVNAVNAVEQRLNTLGFRKQEFTPQNRATPVLEYRQYSKGGVVCVYELRAIGTTGNADVVIGCFDRNN